MLTGRTGSNNVQLNIIITNFLRENIRYRLIFHIYSENRITAASRAAIF